MTQAKKTKSPKLIEDNEKNLERGREEEHMEREFNWQKAGKKKKGGGGMINGKAVGRCVYI